MFFIVMHHFVVHGLKIAGYPQVYPDENPTNMGILLNSFLVIGVNVFILISGYFSIKQSWKSFLRLYAICVFYHILFTVIFDPNPSSNILKGLFPFSHSSYWFIQDYFFLWLLSPLLNLIIEGLKANKQKFILVLIFLAVFQFYFGWFFNGKYSGDGYNLWNFIFLYFIGRFISLHTKENHSLRIWYLSIYLFISLTTALLLIQMQFGEIWLKNRLYDYNSPLVISASIAFMLFFRNINIKSKTINWAASSVLGVYLITENSWCGEKHLYPFIHNIGGGANSYKSIIYIIPIAIFTVIICLLIDKIRFFISKPIENFLCRIPVEKYIKQAINSISRLI